MAPAAIRTPAPLLLCILDGWGHRTEIQGNAVQQARTPVLDRLTAGSRSGLLEASGPAVGLPPGQMGNSEVGHMSIGAGRIILQDLPRIDAAVRDGTLAAHPLLEDLIAATRRSGGGCHILGLLSPGGVHSHQDHITALCHAVAGHGFRVHVHAFLDGRDVPPRSARTHVRSFLETLGTRSGVTVATASGRYWSMDRDRRWERTRKAWEAIATGAGPRFATIDDLLTKAEANGVTDEFVEPGVIGEFSGMEDGDSLIVANFRVDRVRQLLSALVDPHFDGFPARPVQFAASVSLTPCSQSLADIVLPLFPAPVPEETFGEVLARAGLRQLRVAETEKYAHVTYFLNGGREEPFDHEERILVESPKVATYDTKPEMAAAEVTSQLVKAITDRRFDVGVVNYANADMVGHTGDLGAAIAAVEAVDRELGHLASALDSTGGRLLLTADHGNAEQMGTPEQPHTAHTTNPVPILAWGDPGDGLLLPGGTLADIAPTALRLLGLKAPSVMRSASLVDTEPSLP